MTKATITIKEDIKEKASKLASDKNIRGGLSGIIEVALTDLLKKEGVELK